MIPRIRFDVVIVNTAIPLLAQWKRLILDEIHWLVCVARRYCWPFSAFPLWVVFVLIYHFDPSLRLDVRFPNFVVMLMNLLILASGYV